MRDEALLQDVIKLVSVKSGLQIRSQDSETLSQAITARTKLLKTSAEGYLRLLLSDTNESKVELKELVRSLTVGESYFFRDAGQFSLLRERILPELIKRHDKDRCLRVWSAGCSTGEELYSLAILMDELIRDRDRWNIFIMGTDIKNEFLDKARRGSYGAWSFRQAEPAVQNKYFSRRNDEWVLDERIRRMAVFQEGDLLTDRFPDIAKGIYDMDLILCRNVFIYYQADAISSILRKFADTLSDGGYLMTGHGEVFSIHCEGLRPRLFPESMVYEKTGIQTMEAPEEKSAHSVPKKLEQLPLITAKPPFPTGVEPPAVAEKRAKASASCLIAEGAALMKKGLYNEAIERLKKALAEEPSNLMALYLIAEAFADLKKYEIATGYLRQAIEADGFAVEPYLLLAHIAEENGEAEAAKTNLNKVLYLSPGYVAGYLELAAIYENEGNARKARKLYESAREVLETRNAAEIVKPYEVTAGELNDYLKKRLDRKAAS